MLLHNHTHNELVSLADSSDNALAIALVNSFSNTLDNAERKNDELTETLTDSLAEVYAEKIDEITETHLKEFEKDGYEFNNFCEIFEFHVTERIDDDIDLFIEHIECHAFNDQTFIDGKFVRQNNLGDKHGALLEQFTKEQFKKLASLASEDVYSAFNVDTYTNYYAKHALFASCFGETELEIDTLENAPCDALGNCFVSDSQINKHLSNAYLSNERIYIDQSDSGIRFDICLDWLTNAIDQIIEDESES